MRALLVQITTLKALVAKKQVAGKTKQHYSLRSFEQKSTSFSMSVNWVGSILTIMYMAAFALTGVSPLIPESSWNAYLEVA